MYLHCMQLHCICITVQCGGILRSECFLGANSLLLQYSYSSRGAALPSEPRIFSEDNVRWHHLYNVGTAHFPCQVGLSYNAPRLLQRRTCAMISLSVSTEITWKTDFKKLKLVLVQMSRQEGCEWSSIFETNNRKTGGWHLWKELTGASCASLFSPVLPNREPPYTDNGWQRTPTLRSPMSPRWAAPTHLLCSPSINVKPPARTPAWNPIRAAQNSVGGPSYTSKVI